MAVHYGAPEAAGIAEKRHFVYTGRICGRSVEVAANDPLFELRLKQDMEVTPISRGVNNARNKETALLEALDEAFVLPQDG